MARETGLDALGEPEQRSKASSARQPHSKVTPLVIQSTRGSQHKIKIATGQACLSR